MQIKFFLLLLAIQLAACGTNEAISIAATVIPTSGDSIATFTQTPRITQTQEPTPTEVRSRATLEAELEAIKQEFIDTTILVLQQGEGLEGIEEVNLVRIVDGVLEIEVKTVWAARDRQPDVSFRIISFLARSMASMPEVFFKTYFGVVDPSFKITTYSVDSNFRFESNTDMQTFRLLGQRSISYEEWQEVSGAGFK